MISEVTSAQEPPSCWASEPHWFTEATTVNVVSQESLAPADAAVALPPAPFEDASFGRRNATAPAMSPASSAPTMNATMTLTVPLRRAVPSTVGVVSVWML